MTSVTRPPLAARWNLCVLADGRIVFDSQFRVSLKQRQEPAIAWISPNERAVRWLYRALSLGVGLSLAISFSVAAVAYDGSVATAVVVGIVVSMAGFLAVWHFFPGASRGEVGISRMRLPTGGPRTDELVRLIDDVWESIGREPAKARYRNRLGGITMHWRIDRSLYLHLWIGPEERDRAISIETYGTDYLGSHHRFKGVLLERLRDAFSAESQAGT